MKSFVIFATLLAIIVGAYNWTGVTSSIQTLIGNIQYGWRDFSDALESYETATNHEWDKENKNRLFYNAGNALYKQKSWDAAKKQYAQIKTDDTELSRKTNHNLGNTYYKIWGTQTGTGKIESWKQSVASYEKSLALHKDTETQANYEFVQKKLDEAIKKQEEEQKKEEDAKKSWSGSEAPKENSGTGSNSGSGQDGQKSGKDPSKSEPTDSKQSEQRQETPGGVPQPGKTWTNNGSYNGVGKQNEQAGASPLTPQQASELENYQQSLKEFQKQNGKFLNPESDKKTSPSDKIEQFFQNNSQFQDIVPRSDWGKDW